MGGIPWKPLLENFLFPKFCMAMQIVRCTADEKFFRKTCFEKEHKFGLDALQAFIWKPSFVIISIWSKWASESNLVSTCWIYMKESTLKLVPAIFYQSFIFHQMIVLQKLWKMFFISSKKLFSFSRYSNFCIFVFSPFFSLSDVALEVDPRKILKFMMSSTG